MFRSLPKLAVLAAILPAVILPATASASADYYLTLDGVAGESRAADGHTGQIEIASWSLGASNPTSAGSSGVSAGKVSYSDLSVMISLEKAPLAPHGRHEQIPRRRRCARAATTSVRTTWTITLEEVMVSSFQKLARQRPPQHQLREDRVPAGTGKTMAAEVMA